MSIKIYEAYKMPNPGFNELWGLCRDTHREATARAKKHLVKVLAELSTYNFDKGIENPMLTAIMDITQRVLNVQREKIRDPDVDVECDMVFIPYGDDLIVWPFKDTRIYDDLIKSLPGIVDYGYWNNTDEPDDVSNEEWQERSEVWEKLADEPASIQGFSYSLVAPTAVLPVGHEVTNDMLPNKSARASNLVDIDRLYREIVGEPEKIYEAMYWAIGEGKQHVENKKNEIAETLCDLTVEDLR